MRLFVGIPIPIFIKKDILKFQKDISGFDLKLVEQENLHFTLKFLGEVKDSKEIERKLTEIAKKHNNFDIKVNGVGVFPSDKFVRVVWVGTEENKEFVELAKDVQDELDYIRKDEYREIVLHLTVARVRSSGQGLLKVIEKYKDKEWGNFTVDRFNLYQSVLSRNGPEYNVVKEFKLG